MCVFVCVHARVCYSGTSGNTSDTNSLSATCVWLKVTGKRFAHATGPLVNNVSYVRSRAGVLVRFFHVKF